MFLLKSFIFLLSHTSCSSSTLRTALCWYSRVSRVLLAECPPPPNASSATGQTMRPFRSRRDSTETSSLKASGMYTLYSMKNNHYSESNIWQIAKLDFAESSSQYVCARTIIIFWQFNFCCTHLFFMKNLYIFNTFFPRRPERKAPNSKFGAFSVLEIPKK